MTVNAPDKSCHKDMTLLALWRMFPDDATAEAWFVRCRWPQGVRCPCCHGDRIRASKHPTMPYRCQACYKFFSVKQGTVMQSSKIGYQKWAITLHLLTTGIKGVSSLKLHRDLGVTQKTAWHLAHRIREICGRPMPESGGKDHIAMKTPLSAGPPAPVEPSGLPPYRRPDPIPATPEQVAQALLQTPPKTAREWRYLRIAQARRPAP